MVGRWKVFVVKDPKNLVFTLIGVGFSVQFQSHGDPVDMSIYLQRRLLEKFTHDDVGCLMDNTWERL